MLITHEEAQRLIQLRADDTLDTNNRTQLDMHLAACQSCTAYANQIMTVERVVKSAMQSHWNVRRLPLRWHSLWERMNGMEKWQITFLPTRRALLSVTTAFFLFTFWHIFFISSQSAGPTGLAVSPIPTPTLLATGIQNNFKNCGLIHYTLHEHDTLESIARQFSVPRALILEMNNLSSDIAAPHSQLVIPVCSAIPTGTIHPSEFTTTPTQPQWTTITPG